MKLKISGHNFHGHYSIEINAASGDYLSDNQHARIWKALCGMKDCCCGGGYGEGPDRDSARIIDGRIFSAEDYAEIQGIV